MPSYVTGQAKEGHVTGHVIRDSATGRQKNVDTGCLVMPVAFGATSAGRQSVTKGWGWGGGLLQL